MLAAVSHHEPADTAQLAALCKALGDPLRLDIMRLLQRDSFGVLELCEIFDIQQPSMSHHLKVLSRAGLVTTRREGNTLFYRRASQETSGQGARVSQLLAAVDSCALSPVTRNRLANIQAQRTQQSRLFFQANADRFREQQDLIASHHDYGSTIEDLLEARAIGGEVCIEVGVGEGELLPWLSDHFKQVRAIDISEPMLKLARQRTRELGLNNVEFQLGEPDSLQTDGGAELVSCNMVLHHVASPSTLIQQMARLLRPGGLLLLTDLCQHDQDWARTACGDQWLGFDPDDLDAWVTAAGLKPVNHHFLALRNGFRVQISLHELPKNCHPSTKEEA